MGRRVLARVNGSSMSPLLENGDLVWIEKSLNPHQGEIVLFINSKGKKVVHRYVLIGKRAITMGDSNKGTDSLGIRNIVGVVRVKEPIFRKLFFCVRIFAFYVLEKFRMRIVNE